MSNKTPNQKIIAGDILKYKTNKLASTLALVGIAFSALYFCLLYALQSTSQAYFTSTWKIGFSVILTLFSLLITFLASEGIKNYNKKYCIVLLVLAAVQIVRMFGLPLEALKDEGTLTNGYFFASITPATAYAIAVVWLALSAGALVASAVIGYINCVRLEAHKSKEEKGEIDIDSTLLEMDQEDERQAANLVSESDLTENELKLVKEDKHA